KLRNADARLRPGKVDPRWYVPQPGSTAGVMELGAVAFYGENPPTLPVLPNKENTEDDAAEPTATVAAADSDGADAPLVVAPTPTPDAVFLAPSLYANWRARIASDDERAVPVIAATDRVTDALQVLYTFAEGTGAIIHDRAGHEPALDLVIADAKAVSWQAAGLAVNAPVTIASAQLPARIVDACMATNEVTLEAWVEPANLTQDGPARILTMSNDVRHRNFLLGQGLWGEQARDLFTARLRTTEQSLNGEPPLSTEAGTAQLGMTHLLFTRAASGAANFYVNGELQRRSVIAGDFTNWDRDYALLLANEEGGARPWQGTYALVAIYCRALTMAEVNQNYQSGSDSLNRVGDLPVQ
ncbi:MAG: LamG domain-containing protein, partial [Anaerolineae bacterium]|nr:LamG domain-containing protein [Anaerolineae bacterium]